MAWFRKSEDAILNEALKHFRTSEVTPVDRDTAKKKYGEGFDDAVSLTTGYSAVGTSSFNLFYDQYINQAFKNEVEKISNYRDMSCNPEVADVIENAVNESTQVNLDGEVIWLEIQDDELASNKNVSDNILEEFHNLFYRRLRIGDILGNMLTNYYVDGRVYYETVIDITKKDEGVQHVKILPSETMDFQYDARSGKILYYWQYLVPGAKRPKTFEDALKDPNLIAFYPGQVNLIDYGVYGASRNEIIGYLEKAKQPYNQLKLIETSAIIYRLVRAPERFVFKIDVGNMPRDKAMHFVERMKERLQKKVTYDPSTGSMANTPDVISILENFFIPVGGDGRGSSIETVGGHSDGFTKLDDIYYFSKKMYRALKYPISRVSGELENGGGMFDGNSFGEITRDEIQWGTFLKKHQDKFTRAMLELFLVHLDFVGLRAQYEIDESKLNILMTPPNHFLAKIAQGDFQTRVQNYTSLSTFPEFSRYWLQKEVMKMTDEEIKANAKGHLMDKKLGLVGNDGMNDLDNFDTNGDQPDKLPFEDEKDDTKDDKKDEKPKPNPKKDEKKNDKVEKKQPEFD